jgi:hypothetical protein
VPWISFSQATLWMVSLFWAILCVCLTLCVIGSRRQNS